MRDTQFSKKYRKLEKNVNLRGCPEVANAIHKHYQLNLEKIQQQVRIKLSSDFYYDFANHTLLINDYQHIITLKFLELNGIKIPPNELGKPKYDNPEDDPSKDWSFYIYGDLLFLWESVENYLISVTDLDGGIIFTPAKPKKIYGKAKRMKKGKRKLQKYRRR